MTGPTTQPTRRTVLNTGLAVAGGLALWATGTVGASAAPRAARHEWGGKSTANGWPVIPTAPRHTIEGSPAEVAILEGDVSTVLLYVARRFHYEVGILKEGQVTGHAEDRAVEADFESNYLSGTAIAIRPDMYPTGATGCLFPHEVAIIRDVLSECEGVVRWGGDDKDKPKQGHFQIDVAPGDRWLKAVARKITGWDEKPSKDAGAPVDPYQKSRRTAAKRLADRQRATA